MTWLNDLEVVDPTTVEEVYKSRPTAQWVHGDLKLAAAGGLGHTGGLLLEIKQLELPEPLPTDWGRANFSFASGNTEEVVFSRKPSLALIRKRFRWYITGSDGRKRYFPKGAYQEDANMRGQTQALVWAKGWPWPFVMTFTGTASRDFEKQYRDWAKAVASVTAATLRKEGRTGQLPGFAFRFRVSPGTHQKVGKKGSESVVTPPILEIPEEMTEAFLANMYVGREALLEYTALYHDEATWAAAWGDGGNTEEELPPAEEGPQAPPATPGGPARLAAARPDPKPEPEDHPIRPAAPVTAATLAKRMPVPPKLAEGQKLKVKGFIQDGKAWSEFVNHAVPQHAKNAYEVKGILEKCGWTFYGLNPEAERALALETIDIYQAQKAAAEVEE